MKTQLKSYLRMNDFVFPIKIKNKARMLLSPLLFNIMLEVLADAKRKRNERTIQNRKEEVKLFYSQLACV